MPRSRSMSIESRIWSRKSRASTAPQRWIRRSARVDLPWSMWAMMQKLRMVSKPGSRAARRACGDPTPPEVAGEVRACAFTLVHAMLDARRAWRRVFRLPPCGRRPLGADRILRALTELQRLLEVARGEEQVEPGDDLLDPLRRQAPDLLGQLVLVDGKDLRDVDHARLRQICFALVKENVARSFAALQVGGDRT